MSKITLDLTDEAVEAYAVARGKGDNDMTDAEFLEECVLNDIRELVTQSLIETARAEAEADVVVPDITA